MFIQYTGIVNSLKNVEPGIHFDTTVTLVSGGHPIIHGQVSGNDRVTVQKRVKCTKQSTVYGKMSSMFMQDRSSSYPSKTGWKVCAPV